MSNQVTGIGGEGVTAMIRVECNVCETAVTYELEPKQLTLICGSHVPVTNRLKNDGWFFDTEQDVWLCESCLEAEIQKAEDYYDGNVG